MSDRNTNIIKRGTLIKADNSPKMQVIQVSGYADETFDGVERFQNYGASGVPKSIETPKGAECILIALGGTSDKMVAVAIDDRRFRPVEQEEGEYAIYTFNDDPTKNAVEAVHRITLAADGKIYINAGETTMVFDPEEKTITMTAETINMVGVTEMNITAPTINMDGEQVNVNGSGQVTVTGGVINLN